MLSDIGLFMHTSPGCGVVYCITKHFALIYPEIMSNISFFIFIMITGIRLQTTKFLLQYLALDNKFSKYVLIANSKVNLNLATDLSRYPHLHMRRLNRY